VKPAETSLSSVTFVEIVVGDSARTLLQRRFYLPSKRDRDRRHEKLEPPEDPTEAGRGGHKAS